MLTLLIACSQPTDTSSTKDTADSETTETGTTDTVDSGETGTETGETGTETGETGAETGETGDTGEREATEWDPPDWDDQAWHFTAPDDRGLFWEIDESWSMENFSVPQMFMLPDGRYGMLVSDMRSTPDFVARYLFTSEDGHDWTDEGGLIYPEDFPYDCKERFEHATVWREAVDKWTFIVEGASITTGGDSAEKRYFCAASTADLETWDYGTGPMFSGLTEEDRISVPTVLSTHDGSAMLWYNGDLTALTAEGPGVRTVRVNAGDHAWTSYQSTPIYAAEYADPNAVHLEGGGVRLYNRFVTKDGESGIGYTGVDDTLTPTGDPVGLLYSTGECGKGEQTGECLGDPSFIRTDDGTMYLYFYVLTEADGELYTSIGRAVAVD